MSEQIAIRQRAFDALRRNYPTHPEHMVLAQVAPEVWDVSFPIHPRGVLGWQTRRACKRRGGHFLHPVTAMGCDWRCCACGAETGPPR